MAELIQNTLSFQTFGLRPMFRYLMLEHHDAYVATLDSMGLTPDELLHGKRSLSHQELGAIWGLAFTVRPHDPTASFRAALLHDIHDTGLVGILARSCSNLREVFEVHERLLVRMDADGVVARIKPEPGRVAMVFEKMAAFPIPIQDYALGTTWVAITSLSPRLRERVVALEFPTDAASRGFTDAHLAAIEKDYGRVLKFSSSRMALVLDESALDIPIPTVDPNLKLMLERKIRVVIGDMLSEDTDELRSQVFTAIWALRSHNRPISMESVAAFMEVQAQALTYALRSHGISFQQLKDLVGA
jgi:hypothetical protein